MPSHDACCAPGCSNRRDPFDKTLKFHRIPADPDQRRIWLGRINRADLREKDVTTSTRLCSEHFYEGCKTEEQPLPVYFCDRSYPLSRKPPKKRELTGIAEIDDGPSLKRCKHASTDPQACCLRLDRPRKEETSIATAEGDARTEAAEALLCLSDSAFGFQETESSVCLDGTIPDLDDLLAEEQEPCEIRDPHGLSLSRMSP